MISKSHSSQVPAVSNSVSFLQSTHTVNMSSSSGSGISNSNSNSQSGASNAHNNPKMGSRRIFTPHFKLQVLESYRNDSDCKGNQRATARKYNIHRRQIQKWLQCEHNLRSSVANINQNNVKHQFHNINHQQSPSQQQQQQHQQQQQAPAHALQLPIPVAPHNGSPFGHHHHLHQPHHHLPNQQHHHHHHLESSSPSTHAHQLSLDAARQNVALNSLTVPAIPTVSNTANTATQGVFAAANFAAVVAAAAAASGITTTNTTTNVSPVRPTAIASRGGAAVALHSQHHHQQHQSHHHLYAIPYTHTPANMPITVPMLAHHMSPQHLHHHYPYHNLSPHAHTLPHLAATSSACLPVSILSATSTASETTNTGGNASASAASAASTAVEKIRTAVELRESAAKAATTSTDFTGNGYVHCDKYKRACTAEQHHDHDHHDHDDNDNNENNDGNGGVGEGDENKQKDKYDESPYYGFMQDAAAVPNLCMAVTPMDLSLGSRRENGENINCSLRSACKTDELAACPNDAVVDLTFRKRKVIAANSTSHELLPHKLAKSADDNANIMPIKIEVVASDNDNDNDTDIKTDNNNRSNDANDTNKESNDNYIDVEVEEKSPPSKPIKLFKPYLLDNDNDEDKHCDSKHVPTANCSETATSEQRAPIIWSNHPGCFSPQRYDNRQDSGSNSNSNFQSPPIEKHIFPMGSPYYTGSKSSSPPSAFSYTPISTLSPNTHCPEGSPVSGYESSTSTYSDSSHKSESLRNRKGRGCTIAELQVHAIYDDLTYPENCVRRWLDQERNANPPATNASIALYV